MFPAWKSDGAHNFATLCRVADGRPCRSAHRCPAARCRDRSRHPGNSKREEPPQAGLNTRRDIRSKNVVRPPIERSPDKERATAIEEPTSAADKEPRAVAKSSAIEAEATSSKSATDKPAAIKPAREATEVVR